ncbi:MAG: Gfo/Idh/MocA family oxidoreductase [Spirochaetes bacterium]|nr:Gfo/Idh/MocA family oxidoreductase [Spirochaetota bacterium]MBU1081018.1 Gfo/Idh/MocA family oxidoreductase [Spirochaetota bacterium]
MSEVRVGIIGCGRISDLHARGYLANERASIAATCDSDAALARSKAGAWGAEKSYSEYRELLADPGIDAVDIITPQRFHEEIALAAMAAGKHVSIQKPMTVSMDSADRIAEAAARSSRVTRLFENYVFYPPLVLAKRLIDDGAIGEPTSMRIKFVSGSSGGWDVPASAWGWRSDEHRKGFGMQTFDHGHHMWSVAWFLMGEVEKVTSWIDSVDGSIDCPAVIMWKYKGAPKYGVCDYSHSLEMHVPSDYYANDEWFEVTGSKGILLVARCTGRICEGAPVRVFRDDAWTEYRDIDSDWAAGFKGATDNFVEAIRGGAPAMLSVDQGREILRMDLAIRASSDLRREISLDGFRDGP